MHNFEEFLFCVGRNIQIGAIRGDDFNTVFARIRHALSTRFSQLAQSWDLEDLENELFQNYAIEFNNTVHVRNVIDNYCGAMGYTCQELRQEEAKAIRQVEINSVGSRK